MPVPLAPECYNAGLCLQCHVTPLVRVLHIISESVLQNNSSFSATMFFEEALLYGQISSTASDLFSLLHRAQQVH